MGRRGRERDRDSGHDLNQIAAELGGVVGSAPGDDNDQARASFVQQCAEFANVPDVVGESPFESLRLLPDLLPPDTAGGPGHS